MNHLQVRSIELLAAQYEFGAGSLHAHKVAALASSLFDQFSNQGLLAGLTPSDRCTLVAAGYAHDIGVSPRAFEDTGGLPSWASSADSTDSHHITSFELLRAHLNHAMYEVSLPSLNYVDRSTLLYTILWGSSDYNRTVNIEPLIRPEAVALLSGMLRIANALDVRHRLMVQQVELRKAAAWIRLLVHSFDEAGAEVSAAQESSALLKRQLGLRVFVQETIEPLEPGKKASETELSPPSEGEKYLASLQIPRMLPRPD
ncbi:MAG: hypothetical protein KAQ74_00665 [Dehalococcoidia bacterium]|nr:hypothetical protein [Dehalococcoidia bacterium]